jgi:hypothetical protein
MCEQYKLETTVLSTEEYHTLVIRQNRFQKLYNLFYHLKTLHESDGDEAVHLIDGDCEYDGLPRNYQKEVAFVESITKCLPLLVKIKSFGATRASM